jgi:CheY-like chemotaxis protein
MNTVYLVDDNGADRLLLEGVVRNLGYTAVAFSTGEAIEEAVRKSAAPGISTT